MHWARRLLFPLALSLVLPAVARAQNSTPIPSRTGIPREEILGFDPARHALLYVEHSPSGLAGFPHVTLVEIAPHVPPRRIRLTTDEDIRQIRGAGDAGTSVRSAIEARIQRDIDAARTRLQPGSVIPVSERQRTNGCRRAPFAPRDFSLEGVGIARVTVTTDGTGSTVSLSSDGREGPGTEVPAVTLTTTTTTVRAPYDRVADVRELPGTDLFAVLLHSDACTPDNVPVPATAVLVAPPPPPERPLAPLTHAELSEAAVVRALARRARRRTVDETTGWYEGRTRIVFDNAWILPSASGDRILVQYTRVDPELSPLLAEAGQAHALFALITQQRGRIRVLAQLAPPLNENVFEGTGQEAHSADLDGDGRPEIIVRARHRDGEIATVLRWTDNDLQFVWRTNTQLDERALPTTTRAEVRRCTLGVDGHTLVSRCQVEYHRPGAPRDALPTARSLLVQRVQWNGGAVRITEERR